MSRDLRSAALAERLARKRGGRAVMLGAEPAAAAPAAGSSFSTADYVPAARKQWVGPLLVGALIGLIAAPYAAARL